MFRNILLSLTCVICLSVNNAWATVTINVMIFASQGSIQKMGGKAHALKAMETEIENINKSFEISRIDGKVVLVRTGEVDLKSQCMSDAFNYVKTLKNKSLKSINLMRNTYAADIVIYIVDGGEQCGITGTYGDPSEAFIIVRYDCMGRNYSIARELGYLMGCGNDKEDNGRYNESNDYSYPYTLKNENGDDIFTTIMGYTDEINSSKVPGFIMIPYWSTSNPLVRHNGNPVGDADHDNARQVMTGLQTIADYRCPNPVLLVEMDDVQPYQLERLNAKRAIHMISADYEPNSDAVIESEYVKIEDTRVRKKARWKVRGAK